MSDLPQSPVQGLSGALFEPDRLYRNTDPALDVIAARATRDRWRSQGFGPAFVRLGDSRGAPIGYWGGVLNRWLAERCYASTTDADQSPAAKRWRARRRKRGEALENAKAASVET